MPNFVPFTKEEFELEVGTIANVRGLKFREVPPKAGTSECVYDMTTVNPAIHIVIYSSLPTSNQAIARESGEDAVRINFWIKTEDGVKFKKFKRHYRTEGLFRNIKETIDKAQEYVTSKDAEKWLFAANKAARKKIKEQQKTAYEAW